MNSTQLPMVYCFVDSNVFINYKTFDEVDWHTIVEAREACIVLPPVIYKELSKFKDDNTNEWRQKRVRTLLSKINLLLNNSKPLEPTKVRSSVMIMDLDSEPMVNWLELNLDSHINDDRIIASIISFTFQNPSVKVIFISEDFSARRKAQSRGIQTVDPEGIIDRLERTPVDKRNATPKLTIGFSDKGVLTDNTVFTLQVLDPLETKTQIKKRYEELMKVFEDEQRSRSSSIPGYYPVNSFRPLNKNYGTEVVKYIPEFRNYLEASYNYGIRKDRLRYLEIAIRNQGRQSIDDVKIDVLLPHPLRIPSEKELGWSLEDNEPPVEPETPNVIDDFISRASRSVPFLDQKWEWEGDLTWPSEDFTYREQGNQTFVRYRRDRLLPGDIIDDLEPIPVWLRDVTESSIVKITITVRGVQIPEAITENLQVELRMPEN